MNAVASSPAPATPVTACASSATPEAGAAGGGELSLLPIDFAALLLGIAPAASTQNDAASTDVRVDDEADLRDEENPVSQVDQFFALLAPVNTALVPTPPERAWAGGMPGEAGAAIAGVRGTGAEADPHLLAGTQVNLAVPGNPLPEPAKSDTAGALSLAGLAFTPVDAGAAKDTPKLAQIEAAMAASLVASDALAPDARTAVDAPASSAGGGDAFAPLLAATTATTVATTAAPERTAATAPPFDPDVRVPADADALADAAATRLSWQADQGVGRAEIRLAPPELGKIDIELRVEGKHLHVDFSSANAEVRQVLEAGLPRLRDALAADGLTLAQADVGHRSQGEARQTPTPRRDSAPEAPSSHTPAPASRLRRGLLDEYA